MSIKPTIAKVGDVTFYIQPFDPFRQLRLFGDLQREILPHIGGLLSVALGKQQGEAVGEADERAAIAAFASLSGALGGEVLEKWARLLLDPQHVTFDDPQTGNPAKLNAANVGLVLPDMAAVMELMYHVGKVNFASPLSRWAGLTGLAQKAKGWLSENSALSSRPSS